MVRLLLINIFKTLENSKRRLPGLTGFHFHIPGIDGESRVVKDLVKSLCVTKVSLPEPLFSPWHEMRLAYEINCLRFD